MKPAGGELRLVGIPGTNKVMAGELSRLAGRAFDGVRLPAPRKEGQGILVYPFDVETAALAVRYHRTASRVLWTLFESRAERLEPLYRDLCESMAADAREWCRSGMSFSVAAANVGRFPAGERQVVGVVKNAVIDGAARRGDRLRVDPEKPDIHLVVRMADETVTVSIDLAGRPMNQRGYRGGGGTAPLRENLAAALVMLSRYDPRREVLVDPVAGSGTIAIEAACMARGVQVWVPPREPAAAGLPLLSDPLRRPAEPLFGDTAPLIVANEIDGRLLREGRRGSAAASAARFIDFRHGDFRNLDPDSVFESASNKGLEGGRGVILGNPPYGERLKKTELVELYRDLGRWCRRFRGWRAAFLVANPEFEPAFGGAPRIRKPLRNGPLQAYFHLYDIP